MTTALWIDSHCHLDLFPPEERPALLRRAAEAGVGALISIGTSLAQSEALPALIRDWPDVWCMAGVHPDHAGEEGIATPDHLARLLDQERVIGLGETGLDYYHRNAPAEAQQASFRAHIRAARRADVPVAIHARDADDDIARILKEEHQDGPFDFLLHCFSASPVLTACVLALGGYVSFSGIVTFPKAAAIHDAARNMPLDKILVETDAPYLAPAPHRGQRNEPGFVVYTGQRIAALRGLDETAFAAQIAANTRRLFQRLS